MSLPTKMRAVQVAKPGGPEVLQPVERPLPAPKPSEILVKVAAAGVNFADAMMRMGLYPEAPKPPFVPGYEFAGTVLEVAPGVRGF